MVRNPPGSPLEYPANGTVPIRIFREARAPTTADFRNFKIRDFWIDSVGSNLYFLIDKTTTSGTWIILGNAGGDLDTLTGNAGGAVSATVGGNISVVGTGPITITGNPGTNTLTVDSSGTIAVTYTTDAGNAIPAADVLNIVGTALQGITTSGAGSTVTLTASDATTAQKGVLETATDAEAVAVTVTDKAVVPSNLAPLFASPPAIGGTAAAAGAFTSVTTPAVNSGAGVDLDVTLGDAVGANNLTIQDSGASDIFILDSLGQRTMPKQPCFYAYLTADILNVTGDGTNYLVVWDAERFDQNSDFNIGTGIFTAPVTGKYQLNAMIRFGGLVSATNTQTLLIILTSNEGHVGTYAKPGDAINLLVGGYSVTGSVIADMDASDTCSITAFSGGGAKVVDITANSPANNVSHFSGCLLC